MNWRQVFNILTFLGVVLVNGLANALPINGVTTGEISDSFPVLFTPAGYVFSIWGLIYLLLLGFVIYQALPAQRDDQRLKQVGPWFIFSNLLNTAWIFLWQYGYFTLTLLVMLALLGSLIMIYLRLRIGNVKVSTWQYLLVNLPFSIYLGWITVATVANFSITLYNLGWNGFGISAQVWTVIVLAVATGIGAVMVLSRRDFAFALVLVWAFAGIIVRQIETPVVAAAAFSAALIMLGILLYRIFRRKQDSEQFFQMQQPV